MANSGNCFSRSDHWFYIRNVGLLIITCSPLGLIGTWLLYKIILQSNKVKDSSVLFWSVERFVLMIINVSFSLDTMLFWGYGGQQLFSLSMVIRVWALMHKFMFKKLKPFCLIMCTPWETWCQTAMRYVGIISVRIISLWPNADAFRTFADNRVVTGIFRIREWPHFSWKMKWLAFWLIVISLQAVNRDFPK